jgi:hypothetical protein
VENLTNSFVFFLNPEQVEFFFGEHPSNSTVHNVTSEKSTVAENLTNSFNIILPLGYFFFLYGNPTTAENLTNSFNITLPLGTNSDKYSM